MPQTASYNAKNSSVIADGVYLTGFGEDMIEFEPNEDDFEYTSGAQGDVIISETNDETATATLTLQATSPSLKHMMKLANSKKEFPFWVISKRNGMTEKAGGTKARILKKPTGTLGKEAEDREFEIIVFGYVNNID
ncbi:DUF3277 domain-containing protein [Exiguobacterium sp. SL14]|nr:DUF3277 domain-containing protein [Exiguobacterium sp. SL14]MCY1690738.1 DUF3277 domain-containing protein [Exiguobacterium sp. SL14]